jgi:hypothetical protein
LARTMANKRSLWAGVREANRLINSLVSGPTAPDSAPPSFGTVGFLAEDWVPSTPRGGTTPGNFAGSYGISHISVWDQCGKHVLLPLWQGMPI